MSELGDFFRQNLAQTSDAPLGLEISRAEGSWLVASDGRRYLDFIAGHRSVRARPRQSRSARRDRSAGAAPSARHGVRRVRDREPGEAGAARSSSCSRRRSTRVYFTNSGTEAVECALKVARKFTGRAGFVAFDGAYHGDTMGALALAGNRAMREPFGALPGPVRHLPYNDVGALEKIDSSIAAVIVEPVQAEGGVRIPEIGFIRVLRERCDLVGRDTHIRRGADRPGPHRQDVRAGALRRRARYRGDGEGGRRGLAAGRVVQPRRAAGHVVARSAAGAYHDFRRASAVVCGRTRCVAGDRARAIVRARGDDRQGTRATAAGDTCHATGNHRSARARDAGGDRVSRRRTDAALRRGDDRAAE